MSKKKPKKAAKWNPDSARKSFRIAERGAQTDLDGARNSGKIPPIDGGDPLVEDDFGINREGSKFKIDKEQLKYAFKTTFTE